MAKSSFSKGAVRSVAGMMDQQLNIDTTTDRTPRKREIERVIRRLGHQETPVKRIDRPIRASRQIAFPSLSLFLSFLHHGTLLQTIHWTKIWRRGFSLRRQHCLERLSACYELARTKGRDNGSNVIQRIVNRREGFILRIGDIKVVSAQVRSSKMSFIRSLGNKGQTYCSLK
jgi:hypothetical protein